ncbi:MAG: amidohydrolase family protein [Herbaspirillum sp.]|jgi:5-methylthioadenosine/S-adenosylhomocysteine deaminase|nr:amidohydrolase family protein [Herbaspirillum sp.]
MSQTLIRNVAILPLDEQNTFIEEGYLLIEDDRIVALGAGAAPPVAPAARIIDGAGKLAAPGLVNAHTHSQSATLPGFGDRLSHPAFMWLTQAHTSRRTPDETRLAVLLTAWAALGSGTTAVIDHFPGQRFVAADIDAALGAWEETGMRATLGLRFFDGAFDDIYPAPGVLSPPLLEQLRQVELLRPQPLAELRELMEAAMQRWHGKAGRLGVFPAPSNPDRCSDDALRLCAELAQRYDTGIHTHLLETKKQARLAHERYGVSSLGRLERLGVLSDRWSCAHCCWLDDDDIALMAKSGAVAVLNPESNARLGSGTAPIPAMLKAGVRLALGTDGAGANDNLSMQEAMRGAATLHRTSLPKPQDWPSALQAMTMATIGGAAALRQPLLGKLAPGWLADLALYRMDTPAWLPLNDPIAQMVFAETGAAVDTVLVGGAVVLEQGRPTRFDTHSLCTEIRDMARSLRLRNADLFAVAEAIAGHIA